MKRILITGVNSYIGTSFKKWVTQYSDKYIVDTIDLRDELWRTTSFKDYEVLFHVTGIAHIKETKQNEELYYKVNRDLAFEVAQKAKDDGVKQFIFLSSMSVYGIENGVVDKRTPLNPKGSYGKSKLQAEELIIPLEDSSFKIAVLRPPMVYGKGCKGNYPRLAKLVCKLPLFPNVQNERSMIYIDNLCEFIRLIIDDCAKGLFFPQNSKYVCTSEMVRLIAEAQRKNIWLTELFNPLLRRLKSGTIKKVFGDLVYDKNMSKYNKRYDICDLQKSIRLTETE